VISGDRQNRTALSLFFATFSTKELLERQWLLFIGPIEFFYTSFVSVRLRTEHPHVVNKKCQRSSRMADTENFSNNESKMSFMSQEMFASNKNPCGFHKWRGEK